MTFSILICALNEEKNIGLLLNDILKQVLEGKWTLDRIIIVSDGSTDRTNEIVSEFSKNSEKIILLKNKNRIGKAKSFNLGKAKIDSEFVVSLDADVRLENEQTLKTLLNVKNYKKVGLIGGHPIPKKNKNNVATLASFFSYNIVNKIKKQIKKGNNFFSAHGRILAINEELYKKIQIPDLPGTDQFIYFACLKNGLPFVYRENAKVFYKVPDRIGDYLKQNIRFRGAKDLMMNIFEKDFVNKEIYISIRIKIISFIETAIKHPLHFLSWIFIYLFGKIKYVYSHKEKKVSGSWEISKTTK